MGRWRAPQPPAAAYITVAGFAALEREARELWQRRRDVVRHLAAAAAEGDRSENAEYQYRKKELRGIDRRIGYLERRMPRLTVVTAQPQETDKVFFGALVDVEFDSGKTRQLRIVGSDEAAPEAGLVSMDAPLAKALLGRRLDDKVTVEIGGRRETAFIIDISYPDPAAPR